MNAQVWVLLALAGGAAAGGLMYWRRRKLHGRRLYQRQLERAMADGILTEAEAAELASVRADRDLTEAEVRMVALCLYRRALREAAADARITEQEDATLQRLRKELGLSDVDLRGDVRQLQRIRVLADIERGQLPRVDAPLQLDEDEVCHWAVQGTLADRLDVPGRRSTLRSIEFDMAAAAPFSASGERSALRLSPEALPVDLGIVAITNRRTLFSGARRTVTVAHKKLRTLHLFQDGIALTEADPPHTSFLLVEDPELTAAVLQFAARKRQQELAGLTTRTA